MDAVCCTMCKALDAATGHDVSARTGLGLKPSVPGDRLVEPNKLADYMYARLCGVMNKHWRQAYICTTSGQEYVLLRSRRRHPNTTQGFKPLQPHA